MRAFTNMNVAYRTPRLLWMHWMRFIWNKFIYKIKYAKKWYKQIAKQNHRMNYGWTVSGCSCFGLTESMHLRSVLNIYVRLFVLSASVRAMMNYSSVTLSKKKTKKTFKEMNMRRRVQHGNGAHAQWLLRQIFHKLRTFKLICNFNGIHLTMNARNAHCSPFTVDFIIVVVIMFAAQSWR